MARQKFKQRKGKSGICNGKAKRKGRRSTKKEAEPKKGALCLVINSDGSSELTETKVSESAPATVVEDNKAEATVEDDDDDTVEEEDENEEEDEPVAAATGRSRMIGVVKRAKGDVESAALSHRPRTRAWFAETIEFLRVGSLTDIYADYGGKWFAGHELQGVHAVKLEEGKGTSDLVILALIPHTNSDNRALIVNAFPRPHDSKQHYNVHTHDVDVLDKFDRDEYDNLLSLIE
jgi:hypothetical protein